MSDAQQDQILEDFITQARSDQSLRDEIKAALNQDEIISIAQARVFQLIHLRFCENGASTLIFQSQHGWVGLTTESGIDV